MMSSVTTGLYDQVIASYNYYDNQGIISFETDSSFRLAQNLPSNGDWWSFRLWLATCIIDCCKNRPIWSSLSTNLQKSDRAWSREKVLAWYLHCQFFPVISCQRTSKIIETDTRSVLHGHPKNQTVDPRMDTCCFTCTFVDWLKGLLSFFDILCIFTVGSHEDKSNRNELSQEPVEQGLRLMLI